MFLSIYIGVLTLLISSSYSIETKEHTPILDLPDPFKRNHFQFINNLNDIDHENYTLKFSNYSITKEYNNCSIYEYQPLNFTIDQQLLDDTLTKGLQIIEKVANTEHLTKPEIIDKTNSDSLLRYAFDKFSEFRYINHADFYNPLDNSVRRSQVDDYIHRLHYTGQLFWSYEVDLKLQIKQTSTSLPSYVLGKSSNIKGSIIDDETAKLKYHQDGYYISLTYGDGELCDATGLPRETELQFVCDKDFPKPVNLMDQSLVKEYFDRAARVLWEKEPYICNYKILVGVPALCGLELLSNDHNVALSKRSGELHDYKVLCETDGVNENVKSGYNDEYAVVNLGREFVMMKHPSEKVSDYLIYAKVVDLENDMYLSGLDFNFDKQFTRYIIASGAAYPDYMPPVDGIFSHVYYIEIFDLTGKYIATLKIDPFSSFNLSNKRISELDIVKNWGPNPDYPLGEPLLNDEL